MKNKIICVICTLFLLSCTKNFEKANTNPNTLSKVPPKSLMTPIIFNGQWALLNKSWKINNEIMQYSVQTNGIDAIFQYVISDADDEYLWDNLYQQLNNANEMCRLAKAANDNTALAIGLVIKSWLIANITDIYGDVPYSDAVQGISDGNFRPKFDLQKDIYSTLLTDLAAANDLFGTTNFTDATDILYGGDVTKWKKFCNSLRIRYLLRLSNRRDVDVAGQLSAIVTNPAKYPVFTSIADAAVLKYTGVSPFVNTFSTWKLTEFSSVKRMCSTLVDLMNSTADPRRDFYMTKVSGTYAGVQSGYGFDAVVTMVDNNGKGTSTFASTLWAATKSYPIMNYSELEFNMAEAAQLKLITGSPIDYYKAAVTASLTEWNPAITTAAVTAFLNQPGVVFDNTTAKIITQKWVSLYFVGFESWYDYKRTGFPVLPKGPALQNDGILPTRLAYPSIVQAVNNDNFQTAVNAMGGKNDMKALLWWAKH